MAKIITIQFRRSKLPRRLLNDGWWLQSPPVRPSVAVLPKRNLPKPRTSPSQFTLVHSGK